MLQFRLIHMCFYFKKCWAQCVNLPIGFAKRANQTCTFQLPNVQNMDVQYAGARAAAELLTKSGFRAYATSRMD